MMDVLIRAYEPGNPEIETVNNLYLKLDDRYTFSGSNDNNILMGSIEDDMESLQELVKDEDYFPSVVDWEKLGNMLITISEELSK